MATVKSTECPSCNQFVPMETLKITTRNGKQYHEGCAKEIAEAFFRLSMTSEKSIKIAKKPQRTPQKKKKQNDS